jgi:3-hydroxymyristoyl/3-hydroxydecanoyl-(acyl carrier protein) dehydratase
MEAMVLLQEEEVEVAAKEVIRQEVVEQIHQPEEPGVPGVLEAYYFRKQEQRALITLIIKGSFNLYGY